MEGEVFYRFHQQKNFCRFTFWRPHIYLIHAWEGFKNTSHGLRLYGGTLYRTPDRILGLKFLNPSLVNSSVKEREELLSIQGYQSTNLIQAVCPSLEESDDLVQLMLHQVQIFSFFLKRNVKIYSKRKVKIISRSESESNFSKENWKLFLKRKVKVIVQTKSESYFSKRKCNAIYFSKGKWKLFLWRKVKVFSQPRWPRFTQKRPISTSAVMRSIHLCKL